MTDHKLTGDEVIKALECCTNCICNHAKTDTECPLVKMAFCKNYLMKQSLALINRQKAEIERLNKKVEELSEVLSDTIRIRYAECRAEAIKEFAERLCEDRVSNDPVVIAARVLLKEMTEAENES